MEMETVILTPNKIRLPRSLIPTSIMETLALLLLIAILFLLFIPSLFELNYSKNAEAKETTKTYSEELVSDESAQFRDLLSGLENIEREEHTERDSKRTAPAARNPILVLTNIEG